LTDAGFIRATSTDRIRFAGPLATNPINPSNGSTHIFAADDVTHICASTHGNNTQRLSNTTVSINGAGSSALPVPAIQCPFLFTFFSLAEVVTSNGQIYTYDGTTDSTPISGVNIYLAEGGVSTSWVAANGSATSLNLANHNTPATDHDFWIACSVDAAGQSPGNSTTGAFKISISYV